MVPLVAWPDGVWMVRCVGLLLMARVAGIEAMTAVHLDGNHVARAFPMDTPRLVIDGLTVHGNSDTGHRCGAGEEERRRGALTITIHLTELFT